MRILVLGGTAFFSRWLVDLLRKDHRISGGLCFYFKDIFRKLSLVPIA